MQSRNNERIETNVSKNNKTLTKMTYTKQKERHSPTDVNLSRANKGT